VNSLRDTGSVQDENLSGRPSALSDGTLGDIRQNLLRCGNGRNTKDEYCCCYSGGDDDDNGANLNY
jgi:hypothetical protein